MLKRLMLFGILMLGSLCFAIDPEGYSYSLRSKGTLCSLQYSNVLLSHAYTFGDDMGYSEEQLDEIVFCQDGVSGHATQIDDYLNDREWGLLLQEISYAKPYARSCNLLSREVFKDYIRSDYSNILDVLDAYSSAKNTYMSCMGPADVA